VSSIKRSRCVKHQAGQHKDHPVDAVDAVEVVRTFCTSSRAREARRAQAGRRSWEAPRVERADRRTAQQLSVTGSPSPRTLSGRAATAFLWPSGPRRRRRAPSAPWPTIPTSRRKGQRWRASYKRPPSLRRPDPEASQDRGQGRASRVAARSLRDPGPRVLPRIHRRLSEGWQGPSAWWTWLRHPKPNAGLLVAQAI
jgi:hypothetical protein